MELATIVSQAFLYISLQNDLSASSYTFLQSILHTVTSTILLKYRLDRALFFHHSWKQEYQVQH